MMGQKIVLNMLCHPIICLLTDLWSENEAPLQNSISMVEDDFHFKLELLFQIKKKKKKSHKIVTFELTAEILAQRGKF